MSNTRRGSAKFSYQWFADNLKRLQAHRNEEFMLRNKIITTKLILTLIINIYNLTIRKRHRKFALYQSFPQVCLRNEGIKFLDEA